MKYDLRCENSMHLYQFKYFYLVFSTVIQLYWCISHDNKHSFLNVMTGKEVNNFELHNQKYYLLSYLLCDFYPQLLPLCWCQSAVRLSTHSLLFTPAVIVITTGAVSFLVFQCYNRPRPFLILVALHFHYTFFPYSTGGKWPQVFLLATETP